ncbi:hypothetical protein SELMODRAFT_124314 [Selaginella moellendorffii]|uniref:Uncharacterized protein CYP794A1 n=1 Tax=Selaginella moellendorffii TaxID=88036 RepID=D8ST36_SELML|nr:hypothetical protein SELMODRAFT_124314 [Selaginella moellendorffii]
MGAFGLLLYLRNKMKKIQGNKQQLPPSPQSLPIIGHLHHFVSSGKEPHQLFQSLAAVHGPIFSLRLGYMNVVVVSDRSTAKQVLKTNDLALASRPKLISVKHALYNFQDVVFSDYTKELREIRKFLAMELLSAKKLDMFTNVKEDELSWLVLTLANASEQLNTFKMRDYLVGLTYNVITRMLMGKRYYGAPPDDKEYEEGVAFKKVVDDAIKIGVAGSIADFFPQLEFLDWKVSQAKKVQRELDKFLQRMLDEHRVPNRGNSQEDFLDMILEASFMSDDRIKATESMTLLHLQDLITGGTDSSSSFLEWTLAELIMHPQVLAKAQEEIDTVVGHGRKVKESDIPRMPYLQAVIKEGFRLHSPVPLLVPHYANQECSINGYTIPCNTTVFVNTYAMGRDPKVWDNPLEFDPERFLSGPHKEVEVLGQNVNFELLPFGSGRRSCPGSALGNSIVHFTLATLLHCYDWKAGDKIDFAESSGAAKIMKFPLCVQPTPRLQIQDMYVTNQYTNPIHM